MSKKESDVKAEVSRNSVELNKILVENFVSLQKAITDMAERFDKLSRNIANLLQLFELSARSFMNKQNVPDLEKDKEFLGKLNMLIDQNKTIAKGLTLMENKIRERLYGPGEEQEYSPSRMQNTAQPMMPSPMNSTLQTSESKPDQFRKLPRF
jgi:hypothetical protein